MQEAAYSEEQVRALEERVWRLEQKLGFALLILSDRSGVNLVAKLDELVDRAER